MKLGDLMGALGVILLVGGLMVQFVSNSPPEPEFAVSDEEVPQVLVLLSEDSLIVYTGAGGHTGPIVVEDGEGNSTQVWPATATITPNMLGPAPLKEGQCPFCGSGGQETWLTLRDRNGAALYDMSTGTDGRAVWRCPRGHLFTEAD